jgi:hypothetical protein
MLTPRPASVVFVALACAFAGANLSASDILFRKASRNYDESGELGRAYTREFERRMFTHHNWHQRLYCHANHDDDMDDTLEVYSARDGSLWLSWGHVRPSISREINRRYFAHEKFDLAKSLDSRRITGGAILLPQNVASEIEALWQVMLPGLDREPRSDTHVIILSAPMFIGFRREHRSVIAGSIANLAYGSRAYHSFVDIVDDLIALCRTRGAERDTFLARLPKKMQKLRARLSKSN